MFIEVNPIPAKAALHYLKIIATNEMRAPLTKIESANANKLFATIDKFVGGNK
jgi:dihydrodipicolinate synthase/N-acetylneuraminate lyase